MKAVRALMLVLALSVCAYAGIMPNGDRPEPPPTTSTTTAESDPDSASVYGHIETPADDTDITTDMALNLIGAVLALF
ncbi:MAG TPA: hypothetical protein VGX48_16275 [Pyrinomonadaceae bacterium]|jgi:hypothetical protein|nr:hypothetical protein [Pyrinomonadaceae bacterium]